MELKTSYSSCLDEFRLKWELRRLNLIVQLCSLIINSLYSFTTARITQHLSTPSSSLFSLLVQKLIILDYKLGSNILFFPHTLHHPQRPPSTEVVCNKSYFQCFHANNRRHILDRRLLQIRHHRLLFDGCWSCEIELRNCEVEHQKFMWASQDHLKILNE